MVPLLIGNVFQQLYNIADIIIVGRTIGVNALAAVGAVSPLFMLTMVLTIGLSNGFTVVTGQRYGAQDMQGMRRSIATCSVLSLLFRRAYHGNYAFGDRTGAGVDEYPAGADGGCLCLCNDYRRRSAGDDCL